MSNVFTCHYPERELPAGGIISAALAVYECCSMEMYLVVKHHTRTHTHTKKAPLKWEMLLLWQLRCLGHVLRWYLQLLGLNLHFLPPSLPPSFFLTSLLLARQSALMHFVGTCACLSGYKWPCCRSLWDVGRRGGGREPGSSFVTMVTRS